MSSENKLTVSVASRQVAGETWWEGTVRLEGIVSAKLSRKSDGSTRFNSRTSLQGAARRFAERYGYSDVTYAEKSAPALAASRRKKSVASKVTA